ncbi:MAG TPA: hypothetical protein VFZ89_02585 [Solirubrobacteraceae bacterium]
MIAFAGPVDGILSWIHPDPPFMQRAGHAVAVDGRVWLIDPPDGEGVVERVRALGEPAGVLQLLDRHPRDCAALASQLDVPLHITPFGGVRAAPFEAFTVWRLPFWKEVGLWFASQRILVVPEALAGAPAIVAPGEEVGVHPMRRLLPPNALRRYNPEHLLLGHGPALHGAAARAGIDDALRGSRRRVPSLLVAQIRRAASGTFRG